MGLTLITPALTSPVSIEDARRQCRIHAGDATYDAELEGYIAAAVSYVESALNMALEPQTWRLMQDSFAGDIVLPLGPVIEIEEIAYTDTDGSPATVDPGDYLLRQLSDMRWEVSPVSSWPDGSAVQADFTVGYEGELDSATYTSGTPAALKQAVLLLIAHWFAHKSAVEVVSSGDLVSVPLAFDALIQPYKRLILA